MDIKYIKCLLLQVYKQNDKFLDYALENKTLNYPVNTGLPNLLSFSNLNTPLSCRINLKIKYKQEIPLHSSYEITNDYRIYF